MKLLCKIMLVVGLFIPVFQAQAVKYPYRWVYVSRSLQRDTDVEDIRRIVQTSAEHGLNGMVLTGSFDRIDRQSPAYFRRLEEVKAICRKHNIDIIPIIFSVGYGSSVLAHNKNLAAGIPVRDALYVVTGNQAQLLPDPGSKIINGGFEYYNGNRLTGFRFHDKPGQISFVDTRISHKGKASLRFENLSSDPHGHGRVMQEIQVRPHRCYRLSIWVKTEHLTPKGCFRIMVLAGNRSLAPLDPGVPATSTWRKVTLGFNSLDFDKVKVYAGVWGCSGGKFWLDDLRITEVGLVNVLRRPGTPIEVRDGQSGQVYKEGRDYAKIVDTRLNFRFDHEGPTIRLLPGSHIKNGRRLLVSYYHGMGINRGQVTICMSEPEVYKIWQKEAGLIQKYLAPRYYLLSMDEIRAGGSCRACRDRHLSMARILGDCITRQYNMLRRVNPTGKIFIWSDMLDPNHNAHGNYYLVEGDFTGSWNYIPKDMIIVCWYFKKRVVSLKHFSQLGFQTLAGAYYDGDTLDNPKGWLKALDETSGAVGIMYTTWRNKYDLLGPFGDLINSAERASH